MTATKKILVVIDPTATTQPALERIAHLPRPLNAQVLLLICDYDPYLGIGHELAPAAVASVRASVLLRHGNRLKELAKPLEAQGLDVLVEVRWDSPLHEGIIRKATEWGADLVVKDTHHHSALRRSIFSNTDWSLIRYCPVPLLLVKPRTLGHVPCVVAAAEELAAVLGGQTHVFHSFDVAPIIAASSESMMTPLALPIAEITAEMEKNHTEAVHALAAAHGIPRERVHVLQGGTRDLLVASTDRLRADVVVMGAVSRSALERLFVGSTAEAVLDKLSCDALIVKPAGLT
jgi:universal stress protein E